MKQVVGVVLLVVLSFTHAGAVELKKLALDDATTIGLKVQADSGTKIEGTGSIRITTLWPTTVCLGRVSGLDVDDAKLVYQAQVKSDLDGEAYLEMWALIAGRHYFSRGMNNPIKNKSDWQILETPFIFQERQQPDKVILNLVINGTGTIWIDDITLIKEPLK